MSESSVGSILGPRFSVSVTLRAGIRRLGPAQLEIGPSELCFRLKYKSVLPPDGVLIVPWSQLRELDNRVRAAARFTANFKEELRFTVVLDHAPQPTVEALADILDGLPADATALRCPVCSGAVANNLCKTCGRSYSDEQLVKGLKRLGIGAALLMLGGMATQASVGGGTVTIYYGIMLIGIYYFAIGLIRIVTRRPAS